MAYLIYVTFPPLTTDPNHPDFTKGCPSPYVSGFDKDVPLFTDNIHKAYVFSEVADIEQDFRVIRKANPDAQHIGILPSPLDPEAVEILRRLPEDRVEPGYRPASNAYICVDYDGGNNKPRLSVWPEGGGWIGADFEHVQGDAGPFHG